MQRGITYMDAYAQKKTQQLWDRDILKWNDCIAEGTLDLGKPFYKAFKKKTKVLKLFESEKTEAGKSAMMKSMIQTQEALAVEQASYPPFSLEPYTFNFPRNIAAGHLHGSIPVHERGVARH